MPANKLQPTGVSVDDFLKSVSDTRRKDSYVLIDMMRQITDQEPIVWGDSIIGFGSVHYTYESGREGDMPAISFSPRKANMTIYISDGFNEYGDLLSSLGKYKTSVSCLYINNLDDVNSATLQQIIERSYEVSQRTQDEKPNWQSVDAYIAAQPSVQQDKLNVLRRICGDVLPEYEEAISYEIPTVKVDGKNILHYAAYKDHVSIYPVPKAMMNELKPYIRGKGTLWFAVNVPLPERLIGDVMQALVVERQRK